MDKYIIELSDSLSNGLRKYLSEKRGRNVEDVTSKDVADEIFDIILTEIDWNLKNKMEPCTSWEFYVTPLKGRGKKK